MTRQVVGSMSDWSGMLKDLFRQISDGSFTLPMMKAVVEHHNPFDSGLPDIDWPKTYEALGMSEEYSKFPAVTEDPNFWTVPVIKGITPNKVVKALKDAGVDVYLYINDPDKDVPTNDRVPANGSYAISFKRTIEADEENKNLSANTLKQRGHKGITLLERLLLELGYLLTTGQHLDIKKWTLCSGSRCSGGSVPGVSWYSVYRRVRVCWFNSDHARDDLRSRSAVFLSGNPKD